jgi:hypothetical protein
MSEDQAKVCREEGGCVLVTVTRDQQDTNDLDALLDFAKKCSAKHKMFGEGV